MAGFYAGVMKSGTMFSRATIVEGLPEEVVLTILDNLDIDQIMNAGIEKKTMKQKVVSWLRATLDNPNFLSPIIWEISKNCTIYGTSYIFWTTDATEEYPTS